MRDERDNGAVIRRTRFNRSVVARSLRGALWTLVVTITIAGVGTLRAAEREDCDCYTLTAWSAEGGLPTASIAYDRDEGTTRPPGWRGTAVEAAQRDV